MEGGTYNRSSEEELKLKKLRYAFANVPLVKECGGRVNYTRLIELDASYLNPHALDDMLDAFRVNLEQCSMLSRPM